MGKYVCMYVNMGTASAASDDADNDLNDNADLSTASGFALWYFC